MACGVRFSPQSAARKSRSRSVMYGTALLIRCATDYPPPISNMLNCVLHAGLISTACCIRKLSIN